MISSRIGLRIFSSSSSCSCSLAEVSRAVSGGEFNDLLFRSGSLGVRMASNLAANPSGSKQMMRYWRWSCFRFNAFLFGSRSSCSAPVRMASTSENESSKAKPNSSDSKQLTSYWGVAPRKLFKEDGTEWRWSCFRPWDSYMSDTTIDITKHHTPKVLLDKIAYWTVKLLRVPTDIFFQRRYGCRAMMLETVAAVPGMVGGMLLHLRSLRRFEHSGGWVRALLEEAENERMHLMTFMEVTNPRWYERALVIVVQGIFFNAYFLGYLISPKFAHRIVGYLEEEAIHSYTEFLKDLDNGSIENVPAPAIAKDYWRLPSDATLRDVVIVVRADEAHHRDVNHFASDVQFQGMELQQNPAPLGYH